MKLYFPDNEEETDGYSTSFLFDKNDDEKNFLNWLEKMDISYLRSKIPFIEDGKLSYQNSVIINKVLDEEDEENNEEGNTVYEEVVVEEEEKPKETSKRKKKSKVNVDEPEV